MLAVARLKRAASLPRMKDGRRPPMHPEAVSEGEKAPTDDEKKDDTDTPPPQDLTTEVLDPPQPPAEAELEPEAEPEPEAEAEAEAEAEVEAEADTEEPAERAASPATQTRSKRRSRSRSRSRGSKDFKGKVRANQSPTPVSMMAGDSSQDDSPSPPPAIPLPLVFSPIPHLAALQRSQLLRSPTPTAPESFMFYPGAAPASPMLPSLEAIQRGLFRSNSAAGTATTWRMAFQRPLAGEAADSQPIGKLGRNNTVSGGERTAARQHMFTAINGRIAEAENGTVVEENRSSKSARRRARRRSQRASANANTGEDDLGANFTAPNTPLPQTPSLPITNNTVEIRSRSGTPGAHYMEGQLEPMMIQNEEHDIDSPRRRSVLVEEEDEDQTRYIDFPMPPQRNPTPNRVAHTLDAPSEASMDSEIPLFLNHRAPSRAEPYTSSPFTTPLEEKTANDEDEVVYHADTHRTRTPYPEAPAEREISWIADPGKHLVQYIL